MNYLDTSVLVPALAERHPNHAICLPLLNSQSLTCTHSLAESFAVLTAIFKYPNHVVSEALTDLTRIIAIQELARDIYLSVLAGARARGVIGGLVYDAIHAEAARAAKVDKVCTYNVSNFQHVAPDLLIVAPG